MAIFRYIGDPDDGNGGPDGMTAFGYLFPKGEPVEVHEEAVSAKLAANSHFERVEKAPLPDDPPAKPPVRRRRRRGNAR